MSEQQEGNSESPGDSAENGASTGQSGEASASKESGASASNSKDESAASQSKEGGISISKSKEKSSSSKDGSKASNNSKSQSKEGSASKSKDGSTASQSKESSGAKAKSKEGASATKSKDGSATKSADGSKESKSTDGSKSQSKSKSKVKLSESSKEASTEKSKQKSKEKPKSIEKPKSKEKSASKDKSKSREKSKEKAKSKESRSKESKESKKSKESKEKPKSKDRSKSKDGSQSKDESKNKVKSTASTASKGSQKSKDIKMHKGKKVNLGGAKIGFVGAGKMADAIVRGLLTVAKLDPKKMFVAGKSGKTLDSFKSRGLTVSKRAYDIFGQYDCDIVFLCVHGYVIRSCFKGGGSRPFAFTINYVPNQKHPLYVLSLIGGVNLKDIKATLLDPDNPEKYMLFMHRVMLNIGVGYGIGMGALDVEPDGKKCSPVVRDLLSAITKLDYFPEPLMDAACAIGGNGLALCYYFIANLADGGFKMGLNKIMATKLAAKALQSAAQCLLESNKHPSELQDSVTSQAGPAIYGIHVLDKADVASGFQAAIEGSYRRLKELVNIEPCTEMEAKPFKI